MRPGHISPCVSGGDIPCPQCNTPGTGPSNVITASVYLHRAIHKTSNQDQARRLWEAKKLVDEVINENGLIV